MMEMSLWPQSQSKKGLICFSKKNSMTPRLMMTKTTEIFKTAMVKQITKVGRIVKVPKKFFICFVQCFPTFLGVWYPIGNKICPPSGKPIAICLKI